MLFNLNETPVVKENFSRNSLIEELTGSKDSVFKPELNTEDEAPEEGANPFSETYLHEAIRSINESIIDAGDERLVESLLNEFNVALAETEILNEKFKKGLLSEGTEIALNEAMVFAKSKTLLMVEAKLDKMIKMARSIPMDVTGMRKLSKEIGDTLGDYFGFGFLSFDIPFMMLGQGQDPATGKPQVKVINFFNMANAFTAKADVISGTFHQVSDKTAYITANGRIAWNKDIHPVASISVTQACFHSPGVEGRHILAFMLHEIGHCFYHGSIVSRAISIIALPMRTMMSMMLIVNKWLTDQALGVLAKSSATNYLANVAYTLAAYVSTLMLLGEKKDPLTKFLQAPQVRRALGKYAEVTDTVVNVNKLMEAANNVAAFIGSLHLMNIGQYAFTNFIELLTKAIQLAGMDYTGEEKFADEFAAIHGYGAEQVEFLDIVSSSKIDTFPVVDGVTRISIAEIIATATSFLEDAIALGDPHPSTSVRPLNLVDFYRRQLATATTNEEKVYINSLLTKTIKATASYRMVNNRTMSKMFNDRNKASKEVENDLRNKSLAGTIAKYVPLPAVAVKEILTYNGGNMAALEDALRKKGVKITTK